MAVCYCAELEECLLGDCICLLVRWVQTYIMITSYMGNKSSLTTHDYDNVKELHIRLTSTSNTTQKHNQALGPPSQLKPPLPIQRRNLSDPRHRRQLYRRRRRRQPRGDFERQRGIRHPCAPGAAALSIISGTCAFSCACLGRRGES